MLLRKHSIQVDDRVFLNLKDQLQFEEAVAAIQNIIRMRSHMHFVSLMSYMMPSL